MRHKHFNCNQDRCTRNFPQPRWLKIFSQDMMSSDVYSDSIKNVSFACNEHCYAQMETFSSLTDSSRTDQEMMHPDVYIWRLTCLHALIVFTRRVEIPNRNERPSTDHWFLEHWCEFRNHHDFGHIWICSNLATMFAVLESREENCLSAWPLCSTYNQPNSKDFFANTSLFFDL